MLTTPLCKTVQPLILASASPRRQEMLKRLGIVFSVDSAEIDEIPYSGENPGDFAKRMAWTKASAVAEKHPDLWILGADTVVCLQDTIFGKPRDREDALEMLCQLAGKAHQVITGICLCNKGLGMELTSFDMTRVCFIEAGEDLLQAYVRTGEPMDKAGAYGIQGLGSFLVRTLNGSCSNVVGLPMHLVVELLLQQRIIEPLPEKNML